MIIWILLIALIVTAISIIVGTVFGYAKNRGFRKGIFIGVAICVGLIVFCLVLGGSYANQVSEIKANYEDIMLYNGVVSECDNEEVRFGHYEKIHEYNASYERMTEIADNEFFGALVPKNWSDGFGPIAFYFRGVGYGD